MSRVKIVLDPAEVAAPGRTELVLESDDGIGPYFIREEGLDLGSAEIASYMADAQLGSHQVDFRIPSREPSIPLTIQADDETSFAEAKKALQQKVSLIRNEGGHLKYQGRNGRNYYLDIEAGTLTYGHSRLSVMNEIDPEGVLSFQATPDFYEDERLLEEITGSGGEIAFVIAAAGGDTPGRTRIRFDNTSSKDARSVIGSFRCRHYSDAATAAVSYLAEDLTPLGSASIETVDGVSVVQQDELSNLWTPVLGTNLGDDFLTHTGTNRVFCLVRSPDGLGVSVRLVWNQGDLILPEENLLCTIPEADDWFICDIGEVRLDSTPMGDDRWQGQIQAIGVNGGEEIDIRKVWVLNADECLFKLTAPPIAVTTAEERLGWDSFDYSAGALDSQTAPQGGDYATAGDAADFDAGDGTASRDVTGDADISSGRFAYQDGAAYTDTIAQLDVLKASAPGNGEMMQTILARYADSTHWLIGGIYWAMTTGYRPVMQAWLGLWKCAGAGIQQLGVLGFDDNSAGWRTLRLTVNEAGDIRLYKGLQGGALSLVRVIDGDADLATGGALESGKVGIYDAYTGSSVRLRAYDNLNVSRLATSQPPHDAVAYAGRGAEIRTDGMFREALDGEGWAPIPRHLVDLPRLPVAGVEDRDVEVFLMQSTTDLDKLPASVGTLPCSVEVHHRASWIYPPDEPVPGPEVLEPIMGMEVWFRSDAGIDAADGEKFALWQDRSGHGSHAEQADSAKQLTYVEDVWRGKPGALCAGGTGMLTPPDLGPWDQATMFLVAQPLSPGVAEPSFAGLFVDAQSLGERQSIYPFEGHWVGDAGSKIPLGLPNDGPSILCLVIDGVNSWGTCDGLQWYDVADAGSNALSAFTIGGSYDFGSGLDGYLFEFIYYGQILSAPQIANNLEYLG